MEPRDATRDDVTGVAFPMVDGRRSSSAAGRAVFAAAAGTVDPDLAREIEAERDWRKGYLRHVRRLVEAEVSAGGDATAAPRAGLEALHDRFELVRDGEAVPTGRALVEVPPRPLLGTVQLKGEGPRDGLAVPYRGALLEGDDLARRLDAWVEAGRVEASFAAAIRRVAENPDWLDLDDVTVAVVGAGAEMGPLRSLCRWGATVAAVDLPRPQLWERVLATVREGSGRALVPVRQPLPDDAGDDQIAAVAGADLAVELPEVAAWLDELDGPLVLGNYVYAVGADNVRVGVAADALTARLLEARDDVTVAGLLTPTDVYAVPEEVAVDAQRRYEQVGAASRAARSIAGGRAFAPNYPQLLATPEGARFGIADCLIAQQGPNYALAKRLQRWRLRLARDAGHRVSANIAPATSTRSVTRNRVLAAAYAGAPRFDVEVFDPATSNTLMAAMLVHDLRHSGTAGDPRAAPDHPSRLFSTAAAHGGLWRQPYAPRSVLPLAAVLGLPRLAVGRGAR